MKNFERITIDPAQMGGVQCIRHIRIPVAPVLRLLAGGLSDREVLAEYPDLENFLLITPYRRAWPNFLQQPDVQHGATGALIASRTLCPSASAVNGFRRSMGTSCTPWVAISSAV